MSDQSGKQGEQTWKKDFPIKQSEEHGMSRREFGKFLSIGAVGFLGGGALWKSGILNAHPEATKEKVVAKVGEVEVGGYKLFRYPSENQPCILIHLEEGNYVAYSQSCTHLMCPVHYNKEDSQLVCPCHNGYFNAKDGSVIAGPPPKALPSYPVEIRSGKIIVKPA